MYIDVARRYFLGLQSQVTDCTSTLHVITFSAYKAKIQIVQRRCTSLLSRLTKPSYRMYINVVRRYFLGLQSQDTDCTTTLHVVTFSACKAKLQNVQRRCTSLKISACKAEVQGAK